MPGRGRDRKKEGTEMGRGDEEESEMEGPSQHAQTVPARVPVSYTHLTLPTIYSV